MHIKWSIKASAIIYYVVLFVTFHRGLINVEQQYKGSLPMKGFWDKNSDFVDGFVPFFALPLLALLIYAHYSWFVNADNRNDKMAAALTFFVTGAFWFVFTFFISMHGYQP